MQTFMSRGNRFKTVSRRWHGSSVKISWGGAKMRDGGGGSSSESMEVYEGLISWLVNLMTPHDAQAISPETGASY